MFDPSIPKKTASLQAGQRRRPASRIPAPAYRFRFKRADIFQAKKRRISQDASQSPSFISSFRNRVKLRRMNFSSPKASMRSVTVPSLIQETKVLARSPAGFFLPVFPPRVKKLSDSGHAADTTPLNVFAGSKQQQSSSQLTTSSTTFLEEFDE
ncbi:hypothetical protein HU742_003250 [Pseudomonas sp. SWRI102]|uniref:Uncharacterized protein n=1 Tax=Pseudomonas marvdashtae TaxID=2745500 RepID=A0A923FPV6_9PSED|nr:hypothetical protein [Pseudomonas marvdashtae]MBV4550159.1 hypothetical protein [Pseudomonas marvdashtae]